MRWLFVVFVISLCVLLWTAIAVTRHIRRDRQLRSQAAAGRKQDIH